MAKTDETTVVPTTEEDKDAQIEALKQQLAAAQGGSSDTPTPVQAVSAPVIIAEPMTAADKAEADRREAQAAEIAAANKWLEEPVTIQLFKDGKDYKDDLYVSVNNKRWQIKRGVPVTVPRKVSLQVADSEIQSVRAAEYSDERQEDYRKAVDANML